MATETMHDVHASAELSDGIGPFYMDLGVLELQATAARCDWETGDHDNSLSKGVLCRGDVINLPAELVLNAIEPKRIDPTKVATWTN